MTAPEMVCHLSDAFRIAMGEIRVPEASTFMSRSVVKWIALYAPLKWPHGTPTPPECDQKKAGTKAADFLEDREKLNHLIERFANAQGRPAWGIHPFFGTMTDRDWLRWGYLHVDHHLRQFGA